MFMNAPMRIAAAAVKAGDIFVEFSFVIVIAVSIELHRGGTQYCG
jgi:hypothetical protein